MPTPSLTEWWGQLWRSWRNPPWQLLNSLSAQLDQHQPSDAGPLLLDKPTAEILPLLHSINRLMQRSANAIALEQRFSTIAAHEIKTPLSGIRAQAQIAKRAKTELELRESLQMVMNGVDQLARILDQLQDLTRVEGLLAETKKRFIPVNLQSVYLQVLPELHSLRFGRNIRLQDATHSHWVDGEHFAIYLIMRNLIANAILYTPENGLVEIGTSFQDGQLVLRVDDSGGGIAEADRTLVFERYGRLHKSSNEGIGLGLYIVREAAKLHDASILLLTSPYGGLRVEVTFPTGPQPDQSH